jgi:hydrogenase expression/formation protein HypD
VPIVVAGFTAPGLLDAAVRAVRQLESGRAEVENAYEDAVRPAGNPSAQASVREVFEPTTRAWRGLGEIPDGALALRPRYAAYDAASRFARAAPSAGDDPRCLAGLVLRGIARPDACPELGRACTPEHPLGAPMVSSEGACAAYHRFRRGAP